MSNGSGGFIFAVEQKMRELFKADSRLDDIKLFLIGEPIYLDIDHYPAIIIFAEQQEPSDEETGIWVYRYTGYVAAEMMIQDDLRPKDREAEMSSVLSIREYLDAASKILEANLTLGALVSEGETVRRIQLATKIYGLTQRQDNFFNRGDFNFLVETQRSRETI